MDGSYVAIPTLDINDFANRTDKLNSHDLVEGVPDGEGVRFFAEGATGQVEKVYQGIDDR